MKCELKELELTIQEKESDLRKLKRKKSIINTEILKIENDIYKEKNPNQKPVNLNVSKGMV